MIRRHTIIGRVKQAFVQFLNALIFDGDNPTGMSDSVVGNNPRFVSGNSFQGNGSGTYKLLQNNFATLQHLQIDVWVRSLSSLGSELVGGWVTKYNFSGTSSFQFQKPSSSGPMEILIYDALNVSHICKIVENADVLASDKSEFFKATVKIYGINVEGYYNDVLTQAITMTDVMRLVNVPIVIGGTNQGANIINDKYQIARFRLTSLNSSGISQGVLSDINFSGHDFNTPSTDIVYDVSNNGNYASPNNITAANKGIQDRLNYFQKGFLNTTPKVPILLDESAFADGSLLTDPNAIYEPGAFLNDGAKLKQPDAQELKDADIHNVYFDVGGNQKETTFTEIETAIATYPDVYGGEVVSGESIRNITLK
jgi:hypothetical protein